MFLPFSWLYLLVWSILYVRTFNGLFATELDKVKRTLIDLPITTRKEYISNRLRNSGVTKKAESKLENTYAVLSNYESSGETTPHAIRQSTVNSLQNYSKKDLQQEPDIVGEDGPLIQPDEPEECADDDASSEEKENTYVSGVKSINSLSKEVKITVTGKKVKKLLKKKKKAEVTSSIDLEPLQKLFQGKDVEKFEQNNTAEMKKKAFERLRQKLYTNESKLKIFDGFGFSDQKSEKKLKKLVDETLKHEEHSIRYKINFPMFYHAVGTVTLPVDDIVEPFEAWYSGELNMSRIDYYYGMDQTYQRGDIGKHGVVVKITPAHWSKKSDLDKNTMSCWYKEESKWANRRGQTIIPMNIKKFKYIGEDRFNGVPAYKFQFQKRFGDKNNTYIYHVTRSQPYKPLRYEMIGYDHLLRSHYDHYIIDYFSFESWKFDYKILQIPRRFKCYKKLKKMKSHFEANPMWDFLHGEEPGYREHELTQTFKDYKVKHSKQYDDQLENHKRKNIFRHNSRFVHSHNRAQKNYTLELNHLSDISDDEFEMMKGQPDVDTPQMQSELNEIPQLRLQIPKSPLPKKIDWREYGMVSKVHSQSFCASCWAFSAVGAIESAYAIQNGTLEELSVQQLVDCSWGYENNGCRGGWSWRAFKFVGQHGLATRKSYGKYLGQEGYCHCGKKDHCDSVKKMSYRTTEKHDPQKLKIALAMFGPGSISVQCARKTFKFYSSGVYDDLKCGLKTDHAVLVVGYGEENGKTFWLIKNSWGTLWGDNGYMKIAMKNDLCGVLQNGALMVSFKNWNTTESAGFPFDRMKKLQLKDEKKDFRKLPEFENEVDLYALPSHVISYMRREKGRANKYEQ